ncbi:MAG: hypothetical protein KBC96_13920 [Armatimonadetes bacterium]|nr:hypothetical protein [Armatimonadota bacterium]
MVNSVFPAPDRSNLHPGPKAPGKTDADIGYAVGQLADGRPFRAEMWAEDGVSVLAFFLSTRGIEYLSRDDLISLLESNGLVEFLSEDKRFLGVAKFKDPSGNEMFSLNVVIGDEDELYADSSVKLSRYTNNDRQP